MLFSSFEPFTTANLFGGIGVDSFNIDDISYEPVRIPEPSTLFLLLLGLPMIAGSRVRKPLRCNI